MYMGLFGPPSAKAAATLRGHEIDWAALQGCSQAQGQVPSLPPSP